MIKKIILSLLLLSTIWVLFNYGQKISYSDQKDVYDSIRDIASFVFGVMGIWLAIFSPESFNKIFGKHDISGKIEELAKTRALILPIIYSLIIIASTLVIQIFAPILKEMITTHKYVFWIRGVSYSFLGILGLLQLYTITVALNPGRLMLASFSSRIKKDEVHKKLFKLTQRKK
ncbi:hypothetical protein [Kistimonas asteriae]|uniref:hypothetical protein n=1 Tax=Kistimonas asteriae TaxID=517724 RepID=UPI001BAB8B5F|nr:hypothetical protein [Kistimonas asteriae]